MKTEASPNSSELDLGVVPEDPKPCCTEIVKSTGEKKPSYPSVTFRDKQVERFIEKFGNPERGEEWTVTCKLRVSGFSDTQYCKSVDLEMISIIGDAVEEESDSKESGDTDEMEEGTKSATMMKRMKKAKA